MFPWLIFPVPLIFGAAYWHSTMEEAMKVSDFLAKHKIKVGLVGATVVVATAFGTCEFTPAVPEAVEPETASEADTEADTEADVPSEPDALIGEPDPT